MAKKRSNQPKHTSWLKWILILVGVIVLLAVIGVLVEEPGPGVVRPTEGTSFDNAVVIDEGDPIRGMAKAFAHIEAYACLDLGGRVEVKDRGLVEKTDHDYYLFTITCVKGEEKFYFQIDNLSWAFKEGTDELRDGSSIEKAIIPSVDPSLSPFEKSREGVRLEYVYLREFACVEKGGIQTTQDGGTWIDQALIEQEGEFYDMMTVHCNNEEDEVYYFYTYLKELMEE